jgi:hypothetical protein
MKRSSVFIITGLFLVAIMLSSCFLLDNYEIDVLVHKDGSYDFSYEGELNFVPALEAAIEGTFDEDDQEDLQEIIQSLKDNEEFTSVKDLGKGKIKVEVKRKVDAGEDYNFIDKDLKYYAFDYNDEGELSMEGFKVDEDGKKVLKTLGSKLKGSVIVQVPKSIKVISHNADKKKKIDKKLIAYTWKLDLNSEKPLIVIKL